MPPKTIRRMPASVAKPRYGRGGMTSGDGSPNVGGHGPSEGDLEELRVVPRKRA
jgi:hypothetical protein